MCNVLRHFPIPNPKPFPARQMEKIRPGGRELDTMEGGRNAWKSDSISNGAEDNPL